MKIENLTFKQVLSGLVLMTILSLVSVDESRAYFITQIDSVVNPLSEEV